MLGRFGLRGGLCRGHFWMGVWRSGGGVGCCLGEGEEGEDGVVDG
jgi:hypothetical protein